MNSWGIALLRWTTWIALALGATNAAAVSHPWWTRAVIYEIYPRSFQDSNGDGIGDLNGITQRLDYLQQLGVDAIWIAPFYPSPQVDFGYDISDYRSIDPQFGTLEDFDRLITQARKRHIRVLLDMVLNHTSSEHPWFKEAAGSRLAPKHDWYVWNGGIRDAAQRSVAPNNWMSLFGGSAWTWEPAVQQFYYHEFYREQPDLNWRNPAVEGAMFDAMRFWLDRGVAGFRLDAITSLFEDPGLRNERVQPGTTLQGDPKVSREYTDNLPEVHDVMRRLRAMVDSYAGGRLLLGETYLSSTAQLDQWYGGKAHDELHLPMDMLVGFINKLDAAQFRDRLDELQTQVHGSQPLIVFDNHDNVRSWDRYGDGKHDEAIARIIAALLLAPRATALLYQGQEWGQRTTVPVRKEDVRDPIGITGWPREKGRDGERTPMQWTAENPQAGFSTHSKPWLPVASDYRERNVAAQLDDPQSLLNWYRWLIRLRRSNPALVSGSMKMLDAGNREVLAFARIAASGRTVVVCINMSDREQMVSLGLRQAGIQASRYTILRTSTTVHDAREAVPRSAAKEPMTIAPFTVWVAEFR